MSEMTGQRRGNTIHAGTLLLIVLKNGWPFLAVVVVAFMLITSIGPNNPVLDATKWPAFAKVSANQPSQAPGQIKEGGIETQATARETIHGKAIHGILLVTAFTFIVLNTWIFLWRGLSAVTTGWRLRMAWVITMICEVVTIVWIIKLIMGWSVEPIVRHLGWSVEWCVCFADEKVALAIFVAFAFVDCLNWSVYARKHALNVNDSEAEDESKFSLNQALYVDAPVVVGILISVCLAHHLSWRFTGLEQYLAGLFSGATIMHLVASQIIFSIMACRKDYSIARRAS